MRLEKTHESGADEWYCPTCGRRFLMQWPPNYKKIILTVGDEQAIHAGSVYDPGQSPDELDLADPDAPIDEPNLEPFRDWMDEVGFDRLWGNET